VKLPFEKSFEKPNGGIFKAKIHFPVSKDFDCEKPTQQISFLPQPQLIQVRTVSKSKTHRENDI
jgi:hypothetical protein